MSKPSLSGVSIVFLTAAACALLALPALADSQARIVRLSDVQGSVQIDKNTGMGFESAFLNLPIKQGTQVTWTNLDADAHTVLTDPGVSVQFKFVVPANGNASYTFDKPGIYPYFCDAHATWNSEVKRVQARPGSSEFPAAMEGVVFVLP